MRRDAGVLATAAVLFAVFYLAFFWRSLTSGYLIAPSDSLDFGVAAYLSPFELWTQGMYSGYPIAADPQALTWYPVLHLFRVLGLDWNLFLVSAYVIASTTCFAFVRRLTASNAAGALAGLTYGFSGVMLGHIGHFNQIHAAAWVPLALHGLQVIREGRYPAGAAMSGGGFALLWLAGHPQVPLYTTYLAGALVLGQIVVDRVPMRVGLSRIAWSAGGGVLGLALAAVVVLPMVELGELSRRAETTWELYVSKSLPPRQLLGLLLPLAFGGFTPPGENEVPYFGIGGPQENTGYAGLLPLALLVAAAGVAVRHRRDLWLWVGLTVVAAVLCLGDATPLATLFYHAPGYAKFRVPARHLFVTSLCLAVIAGLAWNELSRRQDVWKRIAGASLAVALLSAAAFALLAWWAADVRAASAARDAYGPWAAGWSPILLAAMAGLAWLTARIGRGPAALAGGAALVVALHAADLTAFHYVTADRLVFADVRRSESAPHPRIVQLREELQRTGERALASDGSRNPFLQPNLTRPWNLPAAGGTGSLGIERYADALGMGGPGDVYPETLSPAHRGLDLFATRYAMVGSRAPVAEAMRHQPERWSAVESMQYYEDDPDTAYTLFRNERALPRAWCVPRAVRVSPEEALAAIRIGHLPRGLGEFRPREAVLVEEDLPAAWREGASTSAPANVIADVERRQYLVQSDAPCVLALGEVHYPWWRASVDGAPASVLRVNYAMIGVPVPAGSHVVRLWLNPVSVWLGMAASGAGLLAWLGLLISGARRRGPPAARLPHVPAAAAL